MFSNVLQPSSVSLFSSTGSEPLQLWSSNIDASAPLGSSIQLLHDSSKISPCNRKSSHSDGGNGNSTSTTSLIEPPPLVELGGADLRNTGTNDDNDEAFYNRDPGYELDQTVLHIQSPNPSTTYIQCPPGSSTPTRGRGGGLGLKYPWMHLQVRNLGREWSFEVGLVDLVGRIGVLRMSTFQKHPKLKLNQTGRNAYPLLHLPLSFPARSSRPLTAWTTINLHLPTFIPYFSRSNLLPQVPDVQGGHAHASSTSSSSLSFATSPSLTKPWDPLTSHGTVIPSGAYSHVSFIRVYASCRLRRIWFDGNGSDQTLPWEFDLYSAD